MGSWPADHNPAGGGGTLALTILLFNEIPKGFFRFRIRA